MYDEAEAWTYGSHGNVPYTQSVMWSAARVYISHWELCSLSASNVSDGGQNPQSSFHAK